MALSVIHGGGDDGEPTAGGGRSEVIELGKLVTKSIYVHEDAYNAGISRLKHYAGTHRYDMKEVWSAICDAVAYDPSILDDFMLKYEKARLQKAESQVAS